MDSNGGEAVYFSNSEYNNVLMKRFIRFISAKCILLSVSLKTLKF